MASISHSSFSSRLAAAIQLVQYLLTFVGYAPGNPDLMPASLEADTDDLEVIQEEHTQKHYLYSQAATNRRKFFTKEPESIAKLLSPIGSIVRAKFGKDSQQYKSVNTLIKKIRGEKPVKVTSESSEETISQCEKSYGSQLSYFKDIITLLIQFGPAYAPANTSIKVINLQAVLLDATDATNAVSTSLALYKPLIATRIEGFINLNVKAQEIKGMVKSQYTFNSYEYKLVKGLKI